MKLNIVKVKFVSRHIQGGLLEVQSGKPLVPRNVKGIVFLYFVKNLLAVFLSFYFLHLHIAFLALIHMEKPGLKKQNTFCTELCLLKWS